MPNTIEATTLRSNALGLVATVSLTAAYMGPALSVYALFGPMSSLVGTGVGFVMLIGMIVTLLSAISFGMLAKEMPGAGGVYRWTTITLGESLGLWVGLASAIYYSICILFPPIVFGQFFNEFLQQLGVNTSFWTWLAGALLLITIGATITYRGIVVSSHMALAFLLIEVVVIVALAATFIGVAIANHNFSIAPVTFGACKGGVSGLFLAMPMALLSMTCDAAIPTSEETRNAKWTIPMAVVLTCTLVGIWYVVGFSAFALSQTPEEVAAMSANTNYVSPITPMAGKVWGPMKVLVSLTAMSAALGGFIPSVTAASRMIFAMSRERKLPKVLGSLHPRFLSPWNAQHLLYGAVLLATIPGVWMYGTDRTLEWWSGSFAWFVGVVYVFANVVNCIYYLRFARERFHLVLNLAIPAIAAAVQLLVLWQSVVIQLWQSGALGRRAQAFIAFVSIGTLLYVLYVRGKGTSSAARREDPPVPVGDEIA